MKGLLALSGLFMLFLAALTSAHAQASGGCSGVPNSTVGSITYAPSGVKNSTRQWARRIPQCGTSTQVVADGVVMLLLWLYASNGALLMGGEMNSQIAKAPGGCG